MANEENLKKGKETQFRTGEEQAKVARKGGIASGEARRQRKTLREELIMLLEMNDNNNKISVALLERALKGDIQAFTTIRDTIGEKPVDKVEADVNKEVSISIELSDD